MLPFIASKAPSPPLDPPLPNERLRGLRVRPKMLLLVSADCGRSGQAQKEASGLGRPYHHCLRNVGLAENDGTELLQQVHKHAVALCRLITQRRKACARTSLSCGSTKEAAQRTDARIDTLEVKLVLQRNRKAVQGSVEFSGPLQVLVEFGSLCSRGVKRDLGEAVGLTKRASAAAYCSAATLRTS